MATEWQLLVRKVMKENKGMPFGDILKLAKKQYKSSPSKTSTPYQKSRKSNKSRKANKSRKSRK